MTARICALAALALGVLAVSRAADPPAPTASVRDAIYFGPGGAVRIRFDISIDGKPADAVWDAAIDGLFAHCDRNGDGTLDTTERAAFVVPPRRDGRMTADGMPFVDTLRLTFNPKDEKVTRPQFGEAMKAANRGPVTLRTVAGRSDSQLLSAALFRHLDTNGDGRLSAEELKTARESLAGLDTDEDEFLSAAELIGRMSNIGRGRPVPVAMRQPAEAADPATDFVFLSGDGPQAVKQLLVARAGARATALKASEFGGDAKSFAALDKDGNGVLDTTELGAWLSSPPGISVAVTFSKDDGALNSSTSDLPGVRFTFEKPLGAPLSEWKQGSENVVSQFKKLENKAGFVERKAVENEPALLALFSIADRNTDDKVDAAERDAALKVLAPLANCRVDIAFADQGSGLFELLDRNGDGRLSPRELVEATRVLMPFAGPDKCVGPKDLIRRFTVRSRVEPMPTALSVLPRQTAEETKPAATPPAWFTKMDRNGDGDVSLREFVGPIELFRKLDRDGDGLISPAEAK